MPRLARLAAVAVTLAAVAGPGAGLASAKVTVTPKVAKPTSNVVVKITRSADLRAAQSSGFALDAELTPPAGSDCGVHHPPSGRYTSPGSAIFKLAPSDALYDRKWCKGTWTVRLSIRTDQSSDVTDSGWEEIDLTTIRFRVK